MCRSLRRAPPNLYSPLYECAFKSSLLLLLILITQVNPQMTLTNISDSILKKKLNHEIHDETAIEAVEGTNISFTNEAKIEDFTIENNFTENTDVENITQESYRFLERLNKDKANYYNDNTNSRSTTEKIEEPNKQDLTTTSVTSKEYQSLLDRFRRKNSTNLSNHENSVNNDSNIINITSNLEDINVLNLTSNSEVNNTISEEDTIENLVNNISTEENSNTIAIKTTEFKVDNSSMEKLIDDATRNKILHDYFKTVNKGYEQQNVEVDEITEEDNFNETLRNVSDPEGKPSLKSADGTSVQVSSFRTPRPGLTDITKTTSNRIISILGLFELSVGDSPRADGTSELAAARLAVQHVNQRGLLPGYKLHLITNDTKCDPGVGVDRFFHALYTERESRMVMLLGTACSEVTESIAKIVPYWNIVQVSFGSTSPALSDRSEFPLFCRTVAPDSSHNPARIAFIRQFGWDTVTAFSQNEEVYSLAVNELVTQLEAANITCAASITFAESDFKEQLQQLKELDTRIIIGSFSQEMIPKIFCEAFKLGMVGAEYAWLVAGAPPRIRGSVPCARSHLAHALEGLVTVTAHRGIVGDLTSYSGLFHFYFYQWLTNQYKPSFVEIHGKACELFHHRLADVTFKPAVIKALGERAWICPFPKGDYNIQNITLPGIKNFPFQRGRVIWNVTFSPGDEAMVNCYCDFEIVTKRFKTKKIN